MKYVICDMDGTLLNSEKQLPKKLSALIEELKKRNVTFGVASGRQYFNLYGQFPDYADDMLFIGENGGIMYEGTTPVYADAMVIEEMGTIIKRARACSDAYPIACGVNSAYLEVRDPQFLKNAKMYYAHLEIVDDLLEAIKKDQIAKITIYDKQCAETNSYPFMKPVTGRLHAVVSGEDWIDISNPGVSKGKAIQMLKQRYRLNSDDFVVFGDFMNDYEMMQEATYSYAMANAHPELKKVSNFKALSNDEDGVVKAVCVLFDIDYEAL